MHQSDWKSVLDVAAPAALEHLKSLPDRRVHPSLDYDLGRDGSTDVALRDDGPNCSLQVVLVMKVIRMDYGAVVMARVRLG